MCAELKKVKKGGKPYGCIKKKSTCKKKSDIKGKYDYNSESAKLYKETEKLKKAEYKRWYHDEYDNDRDNYLITDKY